MEFFKRQTNIDFLAGTKVAAAASVVLIVVAFGSLALKGLDYGIDFTGGTLIDAAFEDSVELQRVRDHLENSGFQGSSVQHLGNTRELLIRVPAAADDGAGASAVSDRVIDELETVTGVSPTVRQIEFVGPQVGEELAEQGVMAVLAALGGILVYVGFRFRWRFALGSVVALAHDVAITVGFFSLLSIKFDLNVVAAILAVTGYSLNDTIVVFDRVREEFGRMRGHSTAAVMNAAINHTLSRTVMTGLTTLLVLVALITVGGPALFGFSLALIIGVVVGTYSSIYIAAATALALGASRADFIVHSEADESVDASRKRR